MALSVFSGIALVSITVLAALMLAVLFEPGLKYQIVGDLPSGETYEFCNLIGALVDEPLIDGAEIEVLTNGKNFYESELTAIQAARQSVHIEVYIFHPSAIADRFIQALEQRALAGVKVRLVVDAIGSMMTPNSYFTQLRRAGGEVMWYQPIRLRTLKRFNNRTHRELMVIDGKVGFIGGAGVAAWWDNGDVNGPAWRDTMIRVTGPLAVALQTSFIENWLESAGEILAIPQDFPSCLVRVEPQQIELLDHSLVVNSSPTAGRATRARMLFQLLIASARKFIRINSPYFLPDRSVLQELASAVKRGVTVDVIVPGKLNNHPIARRASRRRYGVLLDAGVRLHEYQPSMIHAKILIVDQIWSVVGSTNFDNRSFGLNDEVNLAVQGQALARRLDIDFEKDLTLCKEVTKKEWEQRAMGERVLAALGALLERQQ